MKKKKPKTEKHQIALKSDSFPVSMYIGDKKISADFQCCTILKVELNKN